MKEMLRWLASLGVGLVGAILDTTHAYISAGAGEAMSQGTAEFMIGGAALMLVARGVMWATKKLFPPLPEPPTP